MRPLFPACAVITPGTPPDALARAGSGETGHRDAAKLSERDSHGSPVLGCEDPATFCRAYQLLGCQPIQNRIGRHDMAVHLEVAVCIRCVDEAIVDCRASTEQRKRVDDRHPDFSARFAHRVCKVPLIYVIPSGKKSITIRFAVEQDVRSHTCGLYRSCCTPLARYLPAALCATADGCPSPGMTS